MMPVYSGSNIGDTHKNQKCHLAPATMANRLLDRYIKTLETLTGADTSAKVVAYLSAEFLTGPHRGNSSINLGIRKAVH
jgi:glucan phosphorylase